MKQIYSDTDSVYQRAEGIGDPRNHPILEGKDDNWNDGENDGGDHKSTLQRGSTTSEEGEGSLRPFQTHRMIEK